MRFLCFLLLLIFFSGCISDRPDLGRISPFARPFLVQLGTQTSFLPMGPTVQNDQDSCTDMAIDDNGYIYCAGWTNSDLGEARTGGGADAFIAKFKPNGDIDWITQLGSITKDLNGPGAGDDGVNNSDDYCTGIALDRAGNVYCTGYTNGSSLDGPGSFKGGLRDAFVMKLNSRGKLQWLNQIGTSAQEEASSLAVTPAGDVYVAATVYGGEHVSGENPIAPGPVRPDQDVFIVKYKTDGTQVGKVQLGDVTGGSIGVDVSGNEYARQILVDGEGNIVLLASTTGNLKTTNPNAGVDNDIFVWKLSASLNSLWLTHHSASGNDTATAMKLSADGSYIIGGRTNGALGEANSGGSNDAFVMKMKASGTIEKIAQLGSVTPVPGGDTSRDEFCFDITEDREGNIYCTGRTLGSIGEPNADPTHTTTDIFVARWDPHLVFQDAFQFGSQTPVPGGSAVRADTGKSIHIDYFGNMYLSGETNSDLGEPNKGMLDVFIMKQDMSTLDFRAPQF